MKIDRVYVVCNKGDLYFARICIASIRYWNKTIAVDLIKDISRGKFDTSELEQCMQVSIAATSVDHLSYYAKLVPFMEHSIGERIMILDSDIAWLCDVAALMEKFDEDIVIDGYAPGDIDTELQQWYFHFPAFADQFKNYAYPGFVFNVGQMVCNNNVFTKAEISALLEWKNDPQPKSDAFFYEQGMLNYLLAEKIRNHSGNYKLVNFHRWGWDKSVKSIPLAKVETHQPQHFLVHWYGKKNGLTGFLPGSQLLRFYERYYYSFVKNGDWEFLVERLRRTISNFPSWLYESAKSIYLFINPKAK